MNDGLLTEGDLADAGRMLMAGPVAEGMLSADWQDARENHPGVRTAQKLLGDVARYYKLRRTVSFYPLPLAALPENGYTGANTALVYDLTERPSLDERFDRLVALMDHLGLKRSDLDLATAPENETPDWPRMMVINPVELAMRLGLSVILPNLEDAKTVAQAAQAYCQMTRPLVAHLPERQPVVSDWLQGRLKSAYVVLEPTAGQRWQACSTQEQNRPLMVRQMRANPATWFVHEGTTYSLSPDNVCTLTAPDVQIGDLVTFVCLAVTEPWIMNGIAQGTAPRIDISGTRVFGGGQWSDSPHCCQDGGGAWLSGDWAVRASAYCGSLLCRE